MSNFAIAQGIIVLIGILVYYLFFRKKREALLPLPPGPKPLPILGNIRDAPAPGQPEFEYWLTLKEKYGLISSITVLGRTQIFIHDQEAITELLEKSSLKTASRPQMNFSDLCGYDRWLSLMPYGNEHRFLRKIIHQQLGTKLLSTQYVDIQDVESKRFLLRALMDPTHLFRHAETEGSSIILKLAYGYSSELYKPDPLVELIQDVLRNVSKVMVPFSWAVDILPVISYLPEWFPGTSYKRIARKWRELLDASTDIPHDFTKEQMRQGSYQSSYTSKLISFFKNDGREIDEKTLEAIKWTASIIFAAGAETTVSTVKSFFLSMVLNPDVQQKAQEEIDRVVGSDRLPEASDEENLPFVRGVVMEALRFFPVLPMGVAHEAAEDIVFRGYRIPKGAYIRPCVWWYFHDPKTYADPSRFDPERYLGARNEPEPMDAFGYGRRVCPGRFIAQETLFFTISRTLAVFKIGKAIENGKPVDFEPKHTIGWLDHPQEFPYSIVPRSDKHAELIRRVEIDHPWEGSSVGTIQGNALFDGYKARCNAGTGGY
ncbi:cytochrome P450 [Trichoderma compactum]